MADGCPLYCKGRAQSGAPAAGTYSNVRPQEPFDSFVLWVACPDRARMTAISPLLPVAYAQRATAPTLISRGTTACCQQGMVPEGSKLVRIALTIVFSLTLLSVPRS